MKKTTALFLVLISVVLIFAVSACGDKGEPETLELKTLGDAFAAESDNASYSISETKFVYVFQTDKTAFRVIASISKELYDKIDAIDIFDEEHDAKVKQLVSDVKIDRIDDLYAAIPSQQELDKLKGKSGQELLDEGYWTNGYSFEEGDPVYYLVKGDYTFGFTFNEKPVLGEDFDGDEVLKTLTVKSVEYYGISGSATDIED